MVDPARRSRPMDQSSLNIFLIALVVGMVPQESLEEGYKADYPRIDPTDDGCIHRDYCQALHNLLSTYY